MSPESTERLLAFMGEHRDDILAKLAPPDQEVLFEAFRELSLYAATIPNDDQRSLLAVSQAVYSIVNDLTELDEVVPFELVSGSQAKRVSGKAVQKAKTQAKDSEHLRAYGPNIANHLNYFVGQNPLAPAEISEKREGWLERVLERFFNKRSS